MSIDQEILGAGLGLFLGLLWLRREANKVKIEMSFWNAGQPTAKVTTGLFQTTQTYICERVVHGAIWSGAYWTCLDTGRQVSQFDRLYEELNNAARKAQLESRK